MKEIPLTQGQVALVDDEDYEWLNQWKWYATKPCNVFYAVRNSKKIAGKHRPILMHIEIVGRKEGLVTDHINGNGLDNQRHNLRHVTTRQNLQNLHTKRSSIYPGICWDKATGKWRARIKIGAVRKFLGYFINEDVAAGVYNKAVNELGEIIL